jgi:hypothetical protein
MATAQPMELLPLQDAIATILAHLTIEEKSGAVVYVATESISAGTKLHFPKLSIEAKTPAFLAFVDRDPMANWSHSARYILLHLDSREAESYEAALPPFTSNPSLRWRVAYKADSVPDAVLPANL